MQTILYLFIVLVLINVACIRQSSSDHLSQASSSPDMAQTIIDKAIAAHGGALYDTSYVSFTFRDRYYTRNRKQGMYTYERIFINPEDSTQEVRDILNNDGFVREINGKQVSVPDTMAFKYSNSINSVIYFALLPYRLNDPAVIKRYLGQSTIKDVPYHKIEITFQQEGGGKDFEDVFIYWVHPENYTVDYLAYLYYTDEGGIRFREAFNPRTINGIRFQDYVNYKLSDEYPVHIVDSMFNSDSLEKLSEIILEDIEVRID